MKTPMSKQAQLESHPRRYIQPVQHGANLVLDTAGAWKQQDQTSCSPRDSRQRAEEALRRPTEVRCSSRVASKSVLKPGHVKNPQ